MSNSASLRSSLRRTPVAAGVILAIVVIVIWIVAFFFPQGKRLSTLNSKRQVLQSEVDEGNAKVERLKHTFLHSTQLESTDANLKAYVPTTPDIFKTTANYTSSLSSTVAASQMTLTSVTPNGATPSTSGSKFTTIPISLDVSGTYDHLLTLIKNVYSMSRLTDIDSVRITGGGPGTNRTSALTVSLSLTIFTTAKPPTTTTP
jgi:Tfp pilus assembly protein PilO